MLDHFSANNLILDAFSHESLRPQSDEHINAIRFPTSLRANNCNRSLEKKRPPWTIAGRRSPEIKMLMISPLAAVAHDEYQALPNSKLIGLVTERCTLADTSNVA